MHVFLYMYIDPVPFKIRMKQVSVLARSSGVELSGEQFPQVLLHTDFSPRVNLSRKIEDLHGSGKPLVT